METVQHNPGCRQTGRDEFRVPTDAQELLRVVWHLGQAYEVAPLQRHPRSSKDKPSTR